MEVSLLKEPNGNIKKPVLVSKSSHSPIVSRPVELVVANNEQETDKCEHFNIRGYVVEVRKRDRKICSPLFMLHNHTSDEHANSLPPLSVKKFRWWRCQHCLHKTIAPEAAIANGTIMNIQNDEVKNDNRLFLGNATVASHPDAPKAFSCFPRPSEGKILAGRLVEDDSSINVSFGERCLSLCCGKKENESLNTDLIKEGVKFSNYGQDRHKKDQNQLSESIHVAIEGEACQTGEKGEGNISANTSGIALLGENTPNIVSYKPEGTEFVHGSGGAEVSDKMITSTSINVAPSGYKDDQEVARTGKMKEMCIYVANEYGMPLGVDVGIPKDDALPAVSAHMSHHDFKCLDKDSHEASDITMGLTDKMVQSQDDARKPGDLVEKSCHKKARKVRSLEEIIRSEELRHKTEMLCISHGDAGARGNDNDIRPDTSKEKDPHPDHKHQLVTQNNEAKPTRRKNRTATDPNDGEGPSLTHWLKKMPKKLSMHKWGAEAKHINKADGTSKFAALKDLDLNLEYCAERGDKQKITFEKKQHMTPEVEVVKPSLMPQQDSISMSSKSHMITKDLLTKNSHSKTVHSKSTGIMITEKSLHHGLGTQDSTHKKALLSNKKSKRPRVEDRDSSKIHWLKDSFGIQKQAAFQVEEKVTKRQRTMRTCEQEAFDGIPMDIVELLAKNQHERILMNAEVGTGSMHNLSEMTENLKDGNDTNTTGCHGNIVSDAEHKSLSPRKSQLNITGYSAWSTVNEDAEGTSKACHSSSNGKRNHHIDLNQQALISAPTGSQAFSRYCGLSVSGPQLSVVDSNRTCSPQNFCWNGMKMLAPGSDNMDQTVSGQSSFRNSHDGSSVLLNGAPARINSRKVDADRNSNNMLHGGNLIPVAHNAGYQTLIDLSDKHLLNSKDKVELSTNKGTLAAKSFAETGNGFHSKMMGPVDLYSNETISALNLLRLMDRAASSGKPCHPSIHNDHIGFIRESNGPGNELLGSEVGIRSREAPENHTTVGNPEGGQQPGNICKPLRPLPRVGVLGPLLQKELATNSNSSRASFGFQSRNSSELTFLKTNEMEKAEASHSATLPNVMNAQTSVSRDENPKWISSSVGSLANPGCSLARDNIGQVVTDNKDGAVKPLRSTYKMEGCVVNRNPADFAMPDEDSEYMIGYEEPRTRYIPSSRSLLSTTHLDGQKRQKVMKLNDLKRSMRS